MRAIHSVMKKHHWFLTGPEDLTTCAMLIGKPGTPQEIGDHVEAIYRRLADPGDDGRGGIDQGELAGRVVLEARLVGLVFERVARLVGAELARLAVGLLDAGAAGAGG